MTSGRAGVSETDRDARSDAGRGAPRQRLTAVAEEQEHMSLLYRRLDELRKERVALRDRYIRHSDNTPGGRVERDVAYASHSAAVQSLNAAEDRLCFGRLDRDDGESMHIGRMGIFDDTGDHEQLLMDWRAPSSRPFYVATAANPLGLRRRRYIRTRRRTVEAVSDEFLDLTDPEMAAAAANSAVGPAGEAALLAAVQAPRTGRMADIVATIQSEQDRIIRADQAGIMVVQGGPGTGKTAVALHRAAYLLYNHRAQLEQRGVLIIGPNPTFLGYISQVLPSLGENAVVLSTIADLFPGVSRPGDRRAGGGPGQGPDGDDDGDRQRRAAPAGDPGRHDQGPIRRRSGRPAGARPPPADRRPGPGLGVPPAAQQGPLGVRQTGHRRPGRPGRSRLGTRPGRRKPRHRRRSRAPSGRI